MKELIELFSLEHVNRAAAKFDITKCKWMNQQHILLLQPDEFVQRALPFCTKHGLTDTAQLRTAIASVQSKVQLLREVPKWVHWVEEVQYEADAMEGLQDNAREMLNALAEAFRALPEWDAEAAFALIKPLCKERGVKVGAGMYPLRVALTGSHVGPGMDVILGTLGRDEVLRRIEIFPR